MNGWGFTPESFAAIGTVGAFLFGFVVLARDVAHTRAIEHERPT